jgi:hypothetical protein
MFQRLARPGLDRDRGQRIGSTSNVPMVTQRPPSEAEKRAIAEASKQMEQRPPRVTINIEQPKDKPWRISPSHADALGWQIRLTNALGTSSHEFVDRELAQLVTVFRYSHLGGKHLLIFGQLIVTTL